MDPLTLATARFTIASLFFAAPFIAALVRRTISGRDLLKMAFLGQLAFSTYFWLQYAGVQKTNAGVAAILVVGLFPLATALLAPLGGDRRPGWRVWAALALGFAGVAAVTLSKPQGVSKDADYFLGALCLVANAFAFAIYSLLTRRWMKGVPPATLTGGAMIFGSVGLLLMCAASGGVPWDSLARLDSTQWAALAFLIFFCSVAGFYAWSFALSRIEASRAAVWIYGEPVIAMALGAGWLGERYGPVALAGAAAIAVSAVAVSRSRNRR
jgi:drug/metabolite transporter (DMT)-like permease